MGEIMQELKDVIEIQNGNQVTNTFNAAEYASRLAKLRTHMVSIVNFDDVFKLLHDFPHMPLVLLGNVWFSGNLKCYWCLEIWLSGANSKWVRYLRKY